MSVMISFQNGYVENGCYFYPLANEVGKGYSNATVRPSFCPSGVP